MATRKYWSMSPSAWAYDYKQCRLCWRRQVVGDPLRAPYRPFPGIFNKIDKAFKGYFHGQPTTAVSPYLEDGIIVANSEAIMQSHTIDMYEGLPIVMRGKLDSLAVYDSGKVGIIDFKTADPKDNVTRYRAQLHSYVYMLEHPGGTHAPREVSHIALHCFTPLGVEEDLISGTVSITGELRYIPLELDRKWFKDEFLKEAVVTLMTEDRLAPGADCPDCKRDALVGAAAVKEARLADDFE